ncbi:MAG: hypothetical protein ACOYWZ_15510 [Bacillota bacterium]
MAGCTTPDASKDNVQKKIAEYLKKTYEKEFVVKKPVSTDNNTYEVWAYPKDDPEIGFKVSWKSGEPGEFKESYMNALWTSQAKEEFNKLLKDIYGEELKSIYSVQFNYKFHDIDLSEVKNLSYSDLLKTYTDKIRCGMEYYVFVDETIDKRKEAEKIYSLVKQHVLDKNISTFELQ